MCFCGCFWAFWDPVSQQVAILFCCAITFAECSHARAAAVGPRLPLGCHVLCGDAHRSSLTHLRLQLRSSVAPSCHHFSSFTNASPLSLRNTVCRNREIHLTISEKYISSLLPHLVLQLCCTVTFAASQMHLLLLTFGNFRFNLAQISSSLDSN